MSGYAGGGTTLCSYAGAPEPPRRADASDGCERRYRSAQAETARAGSGARPRLQSVMISARPSKPSSKRVLEFWADSAEFFEMASDMGCENRSVIGRPQVRLVLASPSITRRSINGRRHQPGRYSAVEGEQPGRWQTSSYTTRTETIGGVQIIQAMPGGRTPPS